MKILIVHSYMDLYGGAETLVVHLARYLERKGLENSIITLSSAPHKEYEGLDIITPKHNIPYRIRTDSVSHLLELTKSIFILRELVRRHIDNFDIVNPHNFPSPWAVPPYKNKKKRTVWMCNEIPDLWHCYKPSFMVKGLISFGRILDKWMVNQIVDEAVVSSHNNGLIFQRRYGWRPRVIYYGIEAQFFCQTCTDCESIRRKYKLENNDFCLIHVGMSSPSKRWLETIQLVERLRRKIPKIKALLVGYKDSCRYSQFLDKYVEHNNLKDDVIFTGHVSKHELRTLYNIAHVAIFPGSGQGSWLSPFEALATGKPVIVSPNLSCSAVITEKDLGVVSKSMENALLDIHERYDDYVKKALEGRKFVIENLTWDNFCAKFLGVLFGETEQS